MGAVLRRRALIGAFGRLVRAMVGTVGIDEAMDGILAVAEGEYGGRGDEAESSECRDRHGDAESKPGRKRAQHGLTQTLFLLEPPA